MTEVILYKKNQYFISVGYYALKHTNRELESAGKGTLSMDNLMGTDMEILEPLLYYSLVMGHKLEDKPLDLVRDDMEFVLNECLTEFTEALPKFFAKKEGNQKLGEGKPVHKGKG